MSDYNWCHGPNCHTTETQSRVRGSGDNKVLRTIKIKFGRYNYSGDEQPNIWDYFCNNRCLHDFLKLHATAIANIAPRREALETPVKVEKEKYESYRSQWNTQGTNYERVPYQATRTKIIS
mgnify:FL=1|tara:strand:+ start:286 stop:648 length:363 start_codon:yes stop_codon:yes gene_type:complete